MKNWHFVAKKAEKFGASRNFLNFFGLLLVKFFQQLEFRKKIGLSLGKILEFSKFIEFRMS